MKAFPPVIYSLPPMACVTHSHSSLMKNPILIKCGMPHLIKIDFLLPMERGRIDEKVRSAASLTSNRPTQIPSHSFLAAASLFLCNKGRERRRIHNRAKIYHHGKYDGFPVRFR